MPGFKSGLGFRNSELPKEKNLETESLKGFTGNAACGPIPFEKAFC